MRPVRPFLPLALACLLSLCALQTTSANQRVQGWCEQGKQVVVLPGAYPSSTTQVQRSFPKCTVTVYITGSGGTLATLYSDANNTPLANPFTADSTGHWFFYAADGNNDVQLSGSGFSAPYTLGSVVANDAYTIASGPGAVPRLKRDKLSDSISALDYGADPTGTADSTTQLNQAITAACTTGRELYVTGGTYLTQGLSMCKGLSMRCSATGILPTTGGAWFKITGANWGLYNPSADLTDAQPLANEVYGMRIENCGWDISTDMSVLGAWRIKGILGSTFVHNHIYTLNNPNPAWIEDGTNQPNNGGNYGNVFIGNQIYDGSPLYTATNTCLYVTGTGGSNSNAHYGDWLSRCAVGLKIDSGNNNTFDSLKVDDYATTGIRFSGTAQGNTVSSARLETSNAVAQSILIDSGTKYNMIFHPYDSGVHDFLIDNSSGGNSYIQALCGPAGSPYYCTVTANPAGNGLENVGINKAPTTAPFGGQDINGRLYVDGLTRLKGGAEFSNNADVDLVIPFVPGTVGGGARSITLDFKDHLGNLAWRDTHGVTAYTLYDVAGLLTRVSITAQGNETHITDPTHNFVVQSNKLIYNDSSGNFRAQFSSDGSLIVGANSATNFGWFKPFAASTGTRTILYPDGNSFTMAVATVSTTAATSDVVAMQGVTNGSYCTFAAGNASAATNIATTYITPGANQITLSHTATASMLYYIACPAGH